MLHLHDAVEVAVARIIDLLFQPTYKTEPAGGARGPDEREDAAAIKTYRYLRLGMLVTVFALLVSILVQADNANCWRGSISAYYYSHARPVFVSGLIVIAVLLIVVKGSTIIEDLFLNIAGMLAPIVAFVPTTDDLLCVTGPAGVSVTGTLTPDVIMDVENNIATMLWAGGAALVIAIVVFAIEQCKKDRAATGHVVPRVILLAVTAALLAFAVVLARTDQILNDHGWSAVLLFAFLASAAVASGVFLFRINTVNGPNARPHWVRFELLFIAMVIVVAVIGAVGVQGWSAVVVFVTLALATVVNGIWVVRIRKDVAKPTSTHWKSLALLYVAVGLAMAFSGAIIKKWPGDWPRRTLVLEITEIGLFAAMWLVQSVERWGKVLQRKA
jgi:hypothetical protein